MMSMVGPVEYAVLILGMVGAVIYGAVSWVWFVTRKGRNEVQSENQRASGDSQ
jgi:hypothetical protein